MKFFKLACSLCLLLGYFPVTHAGINDYAYQIPSYPQHGVPLTSRLQALGNVAPVGQQSSMTVITSPSTLARSGLDDVGTVSSASESSAGVTFLPGGIAYSKHRGHWGYGFALVGHAISQASPEYLYMDEYGGTGLSANNIGFTDIQSSGSRNLLMSGVGYALSKNLRVGASLGLLFGSLQKTATVTQYDDNTFATVLGTYYQTDRKQYNATVMNVSMSWDISRQWDFGLRFFTPLSNGATVQSSVRDGAQLIQYQDSTPYLIEGHTIGADAEFGMGISYLWTNGDVTLFSFEFHDNVYFGSSSSWENWELRFGHEHKGLGRIWRYGGHIGIPYIDGGNQKITASDNGGAQSVGFTVGTQMRQGERYLDYALGFRRLSFIDGSYNIITLSVSVPM